MVENWGDSKRFLAEGILTYTAILALSLSLDLILNLAHAVGLRQDLQVYNLGAWQCVMALFAGLQLIRYANYWRYLS